MSKVVLVVDDEPDIRESVKDVIESALEHTAVVTADSGRAALDILGRGSVDLIVTDYRMPGMNGVQFLREAERLHPGTAHILVTAFDREVVGALGADNDERIVQKPVDPDQLIREVARALHST